MTPLPMTVIAGYLGAGKTTLINRLLSLDHGLKLLIMVNDFGAINIDAGLLASADEDTIALTNGCVCCTMGADLFLAIGDALDRRPRPDHLIIEASGVADPAQIANAAIAEPDLRYGGIVTVVDVQGFGTLGRDPLIGPQVTGQVAAADLIWLSKTEAGGPDPDLGSAEQTPVLRSGDEARLLTLIADGGDPKMPVSDERHAPHISWSSDGMMSCAPAGVRTALAARPPGLFRLKGSVRVGDGTRWQVQVVGRQIELKRSADGAQTALVGIGLAAHVTPEEIAGWWNSVAGTQSA